MADVFLNLLDPLEERYNWKGKSDREIELARRDIVEAFTDSSVEELQGLYRRVVLMRTYTTMPNVAELRRHMDDMLAARKEAEAKPMRKAIGAPTDRDAFLDRLAADDEDAKARARDWLRNTPLGQESLRDGWCRPLRNIIAQIYLRRAHEGKPIERYDEIQLDDIATQTKRGNELIEEFRRDRSSNPGLERAIVLKEKLGPEYDEQLKDIRSRYKKVGT